MAEKAHEQNTIMINCVAPPQATLIKSVYQPGKLSNFGEDSPLM